MLHLYDVSALLYIGNSVERPGDDYISEDLHGLPVRGLRYTLEKLMTHAKSSSHEVIAVMDNPTNKRELYPEYKSQRSFNKEIFVQRELIRYLLPYLGITMLSQPQFEADDLFYCYILNMYLDNKIPSSGVELHCDDRDLLGCIMTPAIGRVGLTSKTPAVFTNNYSAVLSKDEYVHYNSILPYTLFFGKASNNLGRIKSFNAKTLYFDFLQFASKRFKPELLSTEDVFRLWVDNAKTEQRYEPKVFEEIESRIPVVFPRLNWEPEKAIIKGKLDKNIAVDFLTLLQEKPILRMLGLTPKVSEQVNTTLLDKWISLYRSGVMMVDNCQTADTSFFFDEEDNSGNIGGF